MISCVTLANLQWRVAIAMITTLFWISFIMTLAALATALVTGFRGRRRLHLFVGPLTLVLLGVAIGLAIAMGEVRTFPADIMAIHRPIALTASVVGLLVAVTGIRLLRTGQGRRIHRIVVLLFAVAAVTATVLIRDLGGAREAGAAAMVLCALAGVLACGVCGLASGLCVAAFRIPPFIATLAMMLMARGLALTITDSQSVNEVPESFGWLGSERSLGVPHSVLLMFALYGCAHFVMSRTALGRHIYAIGGNAEAARLAGVPVERVQLIVYTLCGLLAGLGGVIMASKHKGVEPNFGFMDELTVIAAVVVGGTSLMGGQGKVLGTLIGAFIIAVIRNGMNQVGVQPNPQMIVMGAVTLAAVLLDQIRKGNVSLRDIRQSLRR